MAKPKAKTSQPPEQWNRKSLVLQVRGSPEWKAWLEGLAEFDRTTVADVADRAIVRYAREIGFTEPAPKR